jgi:hypothetical protein
VYGWVLARSDRPRSMPELSDCSEKTQIRQQV